MKHTDCKVRRGLAQLRKQYGNTVYNSMSIHEPNEAAKEAFYRPPYGGCNNKLNKSNEKTEE